jgi:hypothetical protein
MPYAGGKMRDWDKEDDDDDALDADGDVEVN